MNKEVSSWLRSVEAMVLSGLLLTTIVAGIVFLAPVSVHIDCPEHEYQATSTMSEAIFNEKCPMLAPPVSQRDGLSVTVDIGVRATCFTTDVCDIRWFDKEW